jgi:hypothetical protein
MHLLFFVDSGASHGYIDYEVAEILQFPKRKNGKY